MRLSKIHLLPLINWIKSYEGIKTEIPIQHGTQLTVNKVVIDLHFSTKKPATFTIDIKNETADPNFVTLLKRYIEGLAEAEEQ